MRYFDWKSVLGIRSYRPARRRRQAIYLAERSELRLMLTHHVTGVLFSDSNGNGLQDGDESLLNDTAVFLDLNKDGVRQTASEPEVKTTDGVFRFDIGSNAPAETYLVAVEATGSRVTAHPDGERAIVLSEASVPIGTTVGNGSPVSVVSLDIDLDQDQDLIAVVGSILIPFKNDGLGNFTKQSALTFPTGSGIDPGNIVVGNFDAGLTSDKGPDLAVMATNMKSIVIFQNTGGTLVGKTPLSLEKDPLNLTAGQLDTDPADELVVTHRDGIDVFLSPLSATTFKTVPFESGDGNTLYVEDATIGDFNKDGFGDIAFVSTQSNTVSLEHGRIAVALNDGTGSFSTNVSSTELDYFVTSVTSADLDGDGSLELLATSYEDSFGGGGTLWILDSSPNALLTKFGGTGAAVVETHDMDGDGSPDVLIQNGSVKTDGGGVQQIQTTLYRNRSQPGSLEFEQVGERGGAPVFLGSTRGFAIADVNGRGGPDWILAQPKTSGDASSVNRLTILNNQQMSAELTVFNDVTADPQSVRIGVKIQPTLSIEKLDAEKFEGNSGSSVQYTFRVTRSATGGSSSVRYAVTGSGTNPASGADFVGGSFKTGQIVFNADQREAIITVEVQGDTTPEPKETFDVTLSDAVDAAILTSSAKATGTIKNDDPTLFLTALAADRREGQSGTTKFTFKVSRVGTTGTRTVSYSVTGSGLHPTDAQDFGTQLKSVTIASGKTDATITIMVKADTKREDDEQFTLTATSMGETTNPAIGTIRNDDAELTVSALNPKQNEGALGTTTTFTFTVTRVGDTSVAATVKYAVDGVVTESGIRKAVAADFVGGRLPSGMVTFKAGSDSENIAIQVKGNATHESNNGKGFRVKISNSSPTGTTIKVGEARATIVEDD